jgi:hypothetical protein
MLRYVGVSSARAVRLRELADLGCAVAIERDVAGEGELCVIQLGERCFIGRGATADEAVGDALELWQEARP